MSTATPPSSVPLKTVLSHVIVPILMGLVMAAAYLGGFHKPAPHHVPVAVVGQAETAGPIAAKVQHALGDATLVDSTTTTWLSLWNGVGAKPAASNVNAMRGQTVGNAAWPGLANHNATTKKFVANNAWGRPHFVYDVFGVFTPPV